MRARTAQAVGWLKIILLVGALVWLVRLGLPPLLLVVAAGLNGSLGFAISLWVNYRAWRRNTLGLPEARSDARFGERMLTLTACSLGGILYGLLVSEVRLQAAPFVVFWWTGILLETGLSSAGQLRLERYWKTLDPTKRAAALRMVKEVALDPSVRLLGVYERMLRASRVAAEET